MVVNIHLLSAIFGNSPCRLKKAVGLTTTLHVHHAFFVHFFAVTARLRRESAQFHDLWRAKTQDNDFLILFLNFDTVSEFNSKKTC